MAKGNWLCTCHHGPVDECPARLGWVDWDLLTAPDHLVCEDQNGSRLWVMQPRDIENDPLEENWKTER